MATSLINLDAGYQLDEKLTRLKESCSICSTLRTATSTITTLRDCRANPAEGVNDFHFHPTIP